MQMLIVDDDFTSRKLLARGVRDLGPSDQACDGEEGWEAYLSAFEEGAPYELILLDIVMPGMEGGELLRKIRAHESTHGLRGRQRCSIAMATVLTDKDSVLGSFRDQADGYVVKPYSPGSVIHDLRRHGLAGPE
jgi:two-component system chemotaxis response regulator CheY